MKIDILNIPNFFSSYYLFGLEKVVELKYRPNEEFKKWNGQPFIILHSNGKVIVIDNRDPVGIQKELYAVAHSYFVTNKLIGRSDYQQTKVKPLFPHYPINYGLGYINVFGLKWLMKEELRDVARDIYTQVRRPNYASYDITMKSDPYVFFSGSIWKKEATANKQRAQFIQECRNLPEIQFEGGLIPRHDGENKEWVTFLGPKRYNFSQFQKKTSLSYLGFNNPAVLGAISWRVAEYFNMGIFLLSLPWKAELPVTPKHGEEIHMIGDTNEIKEFLLFILQNENYHSKISIGGKKYFEDYCSPMKQAHMIIKDF